MPVLQLTHRKIHYTDLRPSTPAARDTFIFVHGLGSSQNYYHAVASYVQAHGFRCITFDTSGAARSPYTYIEQGVQSIADNVIAILDALGVATAIVVGHSMGGIVGAHLAASHSDRVAAAILIGPVDPGPSLAPVFEKRIKAVEKDGMEPLANSIPSAAVGRNASPLVKAFIRELLLAQDPAGYVSNCRIIVNATPPAYADISVPVLILAGEEDKSAPLESCQRMFDRIRVGEKKMVVMEGVGHWQCLEAFEEVAKLIVNFYQEIY